MSPAIARVEYQRMSAYAAQTKKRPVGIAHRTAQIEQIPEGKYEVRLAENAAQVAEALRLRHRVFNVEMRREETVLVDSQLEFDDYDFRCRHLVVIDHTTGETVGTYRLNTLETARSTEGFYSTSEFTIEDLPIDILQNGIELGRACVDREHRNTRVLVLLWKALLEYSRQEQKRYFFGCCSVFTRDETEGARVFHQLKRAGNIDEHLSVIPKQNRINLETEASTQGVELPKLFDMYLRLGARVCGPPMIDREFGTIDFFVVLDVRSINERFRRMLSEK
jgi:putative hemolysin